MADALADAPRSIHEIDFSITQLQRRFSMSSLSDPYRHPYVLSLALAQRQRYFLSNQREDLDNSISHFAESILLRPPSWQQKLERKGPIIFRALYLLAISLSMRSEVLNQPEDAIYATKYLFHLRDQPHEISSISRHQVTEMLVKTLALRVDLEAENVMQNIREVAVLTRELFTLNTSDINTTHLISILYDLAMTKIHVGGPDQPLDELIECLQAARNRRPDLFEARIALAMSYVTRYFLTCVDSDYEEAVSVLDEIRNSQDKSVAKVQGLTTNLASVLATFRMVTHGTPEYVEEAIYRNRTTSSSFFVKETQILYDPKFSARQRPRFFGSIEGLEDSSLLSRSDPEGQQSVDEMISLCVGICIDDDTTKIDEAIEKGRSILTSSSSKTHCLILFGDLHDEAFLRTEKIGYLNESICIRRECIGPSAPHYLRIMTIPQLSHSLLLRFHYFPSCRAQDLDEALDLLSQYVGSALASLPERFELACKWASNARFYRHSSVSTAYETALSLMQDTPLFSPTLQLQHGTLAAHAINHSLPLDYASYRIDHRQPEEAIETLERGRALLWSEMRHLRISIDRLLEVEPDLGRKFSAVNRDLEELTKSVAPSHKLNMDDRATDEFKAVDPFGRLLLKQRELLKQRAKLISQIQALPDFDSFVASPSFDKIRSAASSGPVIIINHSKWRSDILIILHSMPPSLISTPNDFYPRASALKDKLLESRPKYGLDSDWSHYEKTLASVLKELYELVGKPVINRLRQLQVPEQSRVWWCPTSVFCSLPLHAMGPIPSDDGELRYFLDLYICSYTPTLSALIQSRHHQSGSQDLNRPSILLVAQPDPSLPTVGGEIQVVQALDTEVTSLISEAATPATVINGFHHHRFVHFACHGTLEIGKPFEAGFELHGHTRLTLLEIVRAHIPTAEFAFLSACHTAEITEGDMMDEGLHLAAVLWISQRGGHDVGDGGRRWSGVGGEFLQGVVLEFETRSGNTVSRKIRKSTSVCGEEVAEEEGDRPGEMGEFRPLWCLTGCVA